MVENGLTEICSEADAGFRCEVLGGEAAGKTGCRHKDQNKKSLDNVNVDVLSHSHIDDLGNARGTIRSNTTSRNLKNGARILSFLYSFR